MPARLLLFLGVLALSAACRPSVPPLTAAPSPNSPSGQAAVPASDLAPELTIETLEGRTFRLSEQRGRPVVLFFTASWCASCIPEIGTLNRLYELYRDQGLQIAVVSIDPSDTPADLQRFKSLAKGGDYVWGLDRGAGRCSTIRSRRSRRRSWWAATAGSSHATWAASCSRPPRPPSRALCRPGWQP